MSIWWIFIASQFPFDFIVPNVMTELKKKGYQELEQLKHLSMKMQEFASNIVITEKIRFHN